MEVQMPKRSNIHALPHDSSWRGGVTGVTGEVDFRASRSRMTAVAGRVLAKFAGVSVNSFKEYNDLVVRKNETVRQLLSRVVRVLDSGYGPSAWQDLYEAGKLSKELGGIVMECRQNSFFKAVFASRNRPPAKQEVQAAFNRQFSVETGARKAVVRADVSSSYDRAVKSVVAFSRSFDAAKSLERILVETERVEKEGSALAAQLYFRRLARILVQENLDSEGKSDLFYRKSTVLGFVIRTGSSGLVRSLGLSTFFDHSRSYIELGYRGLEGLLLAVDVEQRRSRHSHPGWRAFFYQRAFVADSRFFVDLAKKLGKAGLEAGSAAEIISCTQVGQRAYMAQRLYDAPGLVRIYEAVKPFGTSAEAFAGFATEVWDANVTVSGKRSRIYDLISGLAGSESTAEAAAWLISKPSIWDTGRPEIILAMAKLPHAPARLGMLLDCLGDELKMSALFNLGPGASEGEIKALGGLLVTQASEQQQAPISSPAVSASPGRSSQATGKAQFVPFWISTYQNIPEIYNGLLTLYASLPQHIKGAVKQLDYEAKLHKGKSELVLMRYVCLVNGLSTELRNRVLGNRLLLAGLTSRAFEDGLVERLNGVVGSAVNSYAGLYDILLPSQRLILEEPGQKQHAFQDGYNEVAETWDGVFTRIALMKSPGISMPKAGALSTRLAGIGIELVLVNPGKRGSFPDCDGAVITAAGGRHIDAYNLHSQGIPVRVVPGLGEQQIMSAAVELRERRYRPLSA